MDCKSNSNISVVKPSLPPLSEFVKYLEEIWDNKILTNSGPLHQRLEAELADYLGVKYVCLVNNGMTALQIALQALELSGEVITTPYSFVATTHALRLNKLEPVFVDIEPLGFNIDSRKIEAAITDKTCAIMPVHCYGHPCNVDAIKKIAERNGLKVIYDAAHAFAVKDEFGSILNYGDLSVLSFHATKVFNTFEGGAIICHAKEMKEKIDNIKNFGILNEERIIAVGSNGKMSEINAAMGLAQLPYVKDAIAARKAIYNRYKESLDGLSDLILLDTDENIQYNYSYFPVLINGFGNRDKIYNELKASNIFSRRYFYPLISNIDEYKNILSASIVNLIEANKRSREILCLPIYPDLKLEDQDRILDVLIRVLYNNIEIDSKHIEAV